MSRFDFTESLIAQLTYQQDRAEKAEAEVARLRKVLREMRDELDFRAAVAEYDARERGREDFWSQREATGR